MARKTQLRLLSERPAPEGDQDERRVIDAFPAPPPPVNDQLSADVLEILRKHNERVEGELRQTTALATAAIERVDGVVGRVEATEGVVQAIAAKTDQVEKGAQAAGQAILSQVSELVSADRMHARRQIAAASILAGLQSLGSRLAVAPALLALVAAVWLWSQILADPKPLQLIALALFGAVVVAPAIWLGRCRERKDAG